MNIAPELARPIDDYLRAVEARLASKHPDVRRELLAELRAHIEEALHRRGGDQPTLADVQAVLGAMDAPDSFGDEPRALADTPTAAGSVPAPSRGSRKWFLLGLGFLLVNAYGVWKLRTPTAPSPDAAPQVVKFEPGDRGAVAEKTPLRWFFSTDVLAPSNGTPARIVPEVKGRYTWVSPTELMFEPAAPWPACQVYGITLERTLRGQGGAVAGETSHTVASPALALSRVETINVSRDRSATIRLVFNAAPDFQTLPERLSLADAAGNDIEFEFQARDPRDAVVTIDTAAGAPDTLFLSLKAPLPPMNGLLGLDNDLRVKVDLPKDLALQRLAPYSPAFEPCLLYAYFTEGLDAAGAKDLIRVEPAVKLVVEPLSRWEGPGCRLTGDFKPGAVYTLTFKAGLKSVNDRSLLKDVTRVVQFPDRPRQVTFMPPGRLLSPRGNLTVPLSAMNVGKVEVSLDPVLPQNLVQLALRETGRMNTYGDSTDLLTGRQRTITNTLPDQPNREVKLPVRLRDIAGGEPFGAYVLSAAAEKTTGDRRLILVTDLGLSAKVGHDGVLAWVTSLRDAKPAAGVEVVLVADNQSEVARGTTGPDGCVFLPVADEAETPVLAIARRGADQTYIDLSNHQIHIKDPAAALEAARPYPGGRLEAYVFSDRGVYRPDETVHIRALVRDAAMKAPAPFPALLRVRRPDGRIFKDVPVTLDAFGAAGADVPMPAFLPTGSYTLELALPGTFTVLGSDSIALEDFVPPQIRVEVAPPTNRLVAGTEAAFQVAAQHLFGRAAAGLKSTGAFTVRAAPFAPAAWRGWTFGDGEKSLSSRFSRMEPSLLDEEGRGEFGIETSEAWRPPAAVQVVFEAGVVEASGRTVTQYGNVFVDPYPAYIGVRRDVEGSLVAGTTQRLQVVAVKPDGKPAGETMKLNVKIARETWSTVLRRSSGGRYQYVSDRELAPIREAIVEASGQPSDFLFALPSAGDYLITFSEPDSEASTSIRVSAHSAGQNWASWNRENPDVVEIVPDRPAYKPGDRARLTLKAPFAGTALLTLETDRVITQRLVVLEKNTADVEIELTEAHAPCIHACLTMVRPAVAESVWSAHRATGSAMLLVQPAGRALKVAVEAPAVQRPQAALPVRLALTQEDGAPATAADVVVMAVDEAILGLTGFETPDPLAWWLAPRIRSVELADVFAELMPEFDEQIAGTSAAGGDDEGSLRRRLSPIRSRRFKPVALFAGTVHADATGHATVSLDVPEFSGELRVMAVAYNATQAGHAQAAVKVKRALVVQPSLPRFLAPGDTGELSVELFNESGKPADLRLRVTCGGPLASAIGETTTNLPAGGHTLLRLPLTAGAAPGAALCTLEVDGAGESYRETIELPVRPAASAIATARYGILKAGEKVRVDAPTNLVGASLVQDVWTSSRPDVNLARPLDYLLQYPYGCLEQTVSASLPLLYLSDLAARRLPGSMEKTDVGDFVRQGIVRTLSMQQPDGSFAMWPQQYGAWPWGSIYAIHFLAEAKRAAYTVPQDRLDDALTWLRKRLDASSESDPSADSWKEDMELRAYAAHVLALAGQPQHGWNARLRELAPQLTFAGRVHTACALMSAGEPRAGGELLATLGDPAFDAPRETGGLLRSGISDAALLLSAWMDLDPARPEVARLAARLVSLQRNGHWLTTRDNALAVMALGKYARSLTGKIAPYAGTVTLPDGLKREVASAQDLHWTSPRGTGGAVEIENRGPGELHYVVRHDGVPAGGAIPEVDSGLTVRRDWLDADGRPLQTQQVAQGDLIVVKLTLDAGNRTIDNIAIEDLLPAGLEIENPNLAGSAKPAWLGEVNTSAFRHRDLRDDRLLLFTGPASGANVFYYAVRAVTPGRYVVPAVVAEAMYEPGIRSVNGRRTIEVTP